MVKTLKTTTRYGSFIRDLMVEMVRTGSILERTEADQEVAVEANLDARETEAADLEETSMQPEELAQEDTIVAEAAADIDAPVADDTAVECSEADVADADVDLNIDAAALLDASMSVASGAEQVSST